MRAGHSKIRLVVAASLLVTVVRANLSAQENVASSAEALPVRTWTGDQHRYRRRASFVECQRDVVQLREPDGTPIAIPFDRLSDVDQKYVRAVVTDRFSESPLLDGLAWLSEEPIEPASVTKALNTVAKLSTEEARKEAKILQESWVLASPEGMLATALLLGALLEQSQLPDEAMAEYTRIMESAGKSSYAASARFRKRLLEVDNEDQLDDVYWMLAGVELKETAEDTGAGKGEVDKGAGGTDSAQENDNAVGESPVENGDAEVAFHEIEGWFMVSDLWTWSTSRRAALRALIGRRERNLSFRAFAYLQSLSTFPANYAYLFILLVLTLGVRVLTLPISVKATYMSVKMRRLLPRVAMIQRLHPDEPLEQGKELAALYKQHGVSMGPGCLLALLDLVFVCWALVSMNSYRPQMMLDNAQLWFVEDVTSFNPYVVVAAVAVGTITSLIDKAMSMQTRGSRQLVFGCVILGAMLLGLAAYFDWPAFVFIFWGLLTLVRLLFSIVLLPICHLVEARSGRVGGI